MVASVNIAVSGLNAASTRLAVSSANIANQSSTARIENGERINEPYTPQRVDQVSLSSGGVRALVRDADEPTVEVYDPDSASADENGTVKLPNVNVEQEFANTLIASYDYKANLKVIKVQDELEKDLLNIVT